MAKIFADSKTFVDMKLRASPDATLTSFRSWQAQHAEPSPADIRKFVEEHFEDVGQEFVKYVPEDYVESPHVLDTIRDPDYRQWAKDLNDLWLVLGRKMTDEVAVSRCGGLLQRRSTLGLRIGISLGKHPLIRAKYRSLEHLFGDPQRTLFLGQMRGRFFCDLDSGFSRQ